jgi:hypothetical protein
VGKYLPAILLAPLNLPFFLCHSNDIGLFIKSGNSGSQKLSPKVPRIKSKVTYFYTQSYTFIVPKVPFSPPKVIFKNIINILFKLILINMLKLFHTESKTKVISQETNARVKAPWEPKKGNS